MEIRPWERHWQRFEATDFLRTEDQITHPSRAMIADEAAKIGGTVLECGSATCIDYPLHVKRGLRYVAIDITPKYIERAREIYPGIDARVGSILNIPFPESSVETVYCRAVLEHLHPEEWPNAVREMWRVTRKQMILCLYQRPIRGGRVSWTIGGAIPASFVVNNPGDPSRVQAVPKTEATDLKIKFEVRGNDGPPSERGLVYAVPLPHRKLLELIRSLPRAGIHRCLESPQDGVHRIHYLYIVSKLIA